MTDLPKRSQVSKRARRLESSLPQVSEVERDLIWFEIKISSQFRRETTVMITMSLCIYRLFSSILTICVCKIKGCYVSFMCVLFYFFPESGHSMRIEGWFSDMIDFGSAVIPTF